MEIFLKL